MVDSNEIFTCIKLLPRFDAETFPFIIVRTEKRSIVVNLKSKSLITIANVPHNYEFEDHDIWEVGGEIYYCCVEDKDNFFNMLLVGREKIAHLYKLSKVYLS